MEQIIQNIYMPDKTTDLKGITVRENTVLLTIKSNHSQPVYRFLSEVFKTLAHFHTTIEWVNTCGWNVLAGISGTAQIPEIMSALEQIAKTEVSQNWDSICILNPSEHKKENTCMDIISLLNKRIAIRMVSFSEHRDSMYITLRPDDRTEALRMIYHYLFVMKNQN